MGGESPIVHNHATGFVNDGLQERFDKFDINADGVLSSKEVVSIVLPPTPLSTLVLAAASWTVCAYLQNGNL